MGGNPTRHDVEQCSGVTASGSLAICTRDFINGVVSWAYSATKGGGELAEHNATLVRHRA